MSRSTVLRSPTHTLNSRAPPTPPARAQVIAYGAALERTGGSMPEFVNPKYANAERTTFKKPTRLECMMQARRDRAEIAPRSRRDRTAVLQDFPKLLDPSSAVGFTSFDRWFSFSPVKNAIADAIKAHGSGVYAASPGAGEAAVYEAHGRLLRLAGADVAEPPPAAEYLGLPLKLLPAISLAPRFAISVAQALPPPPLPSHRPLSLAPHPPPPRPLPPPAALRSRARWSSRQGERPLVPRPRRRYHAHLT